MLESFSRKSVLLYFLPNYRTAYLPFSFNNTPDYQPLPYNNETARADRELLPARVVII